MNGSLVFGHPLAEEAGQGSQTIPGYLAEVCARFAGSEAVVMRTPSRRVSWTFDELHRRAGEVGKALVAKGLGPGDRVGVLMANRPEYLSALFGIAAAGCVVVALNTFSTAEELRYQIDLSGISLLLFDTRVAKQDFAAMLGQIDLPAALDQLVELDSVTDDLPVRGGFATWQDFLAGGAGVADAEIARRSSRVTPDDTGGIFFSSGTTSLPKGVVHSQKAFAIQWWRWPRVFAMREPVRSWTGNGLFWSGNVSMALGTALSTGGAVILQPVFSAAGALDAIEHERVSFLAGRPHQWARVQAEPRWQSADLSSLKYVTKGDLITEHPSVTTDWVMPNAFGTTETMTICTAFDADAQPHVYAGSVGAPLPGNVLKIIDPTTREIVPVGTSGEMCIKGPTLMSGYLGKAAAECFDADGFYCTGDGGHVDAAGRFFWEGRLTALIKSGGANVSPEEVDAAIAEYPGVKRSQTVGVADELLGERVVACVVPVEGAVIEQAALIAFLRDRLAAFKCPKDVVLLAEADFAMTANEKPVIAEIRKTAEARIRAQTRQV